MQEKTSEEARRDFRRLLNDAGRGVPTAVTRYGEPVAVVVPADWYEKALAVWNALQASDGEEA